MSTELTRREETRPEAVQQARWIRPPCDVFENDSEWLIVADVPATSYDALALQLDGKELTIEAGRGGAGAGGDAAYAGYRRAFTVPAGIDAAKVSAELQNGVVSVHLPKSEAIKPRRIEVKAS